jgi:hypothetical protein
MARTVPVPFRGGADPPLQSSVPTPTRWSLASTLGPCSAKRAAASSVVNPSARVFSNA